MRVTMKEMRVAGFCSRGSRKVFIAAGINWQDFLDNGIELEDLKQKIDKHFTDEIESKNGW